MTLGGAQLTLRHAAARSEVHINLSVQGAHAQPQPKENTA